MIPSPRGGRECRDVNETHVKAQYFILSIKRKKRQFLNPDLWLKYK